MTETETETDRKRRYERSGKRPGVQITIRLDDDLHAGAQRLRQPDESLAGTIKRVLAEAISRSPPP